MKSQTVQLDQQKIGDQRIHKFSKNIKFTFQHMKNNSVYFQEEIY